MAEPLRLYALRDEVTRRVVEGLYFSSKRRAKSARNQQSAATGHKHVVVLGPDHKRANSGEANGNL